MCLSFVCYAEVIEDENDNLAENVNGGSGFATPPPLTEDVVSQGKAVLKMVVLPAPPAQFNLERQMELNYLRGGTTSLKAWKDTVGFSKQQPSRSKRMAVKGTSRFMLFTAVKDSIASPKS